jgi:hypothetical protein
MCTVCGKPGREKWARLGILWVARIIQCGVVHVMVVGQPLVR